MKKFAIDMPGGRISSNVRSHKAAWAYLRAQQLRDIGCNVRVLHKNESWDDYDCIYLYHGMEFRGSLNLFGGATDETALMFKRLIDYKGQLVSLDIPMPDYGALGKTRLKVCEPKWANLDWDDISKRCDGIPFDEFVYCSDHLVMGDSHSFSAWVPGASIFRMDGKTMHGISKYGIKEAIEEKFGSHEFTKLTSYFGNIDVRHHLCRMPDPKKASIELINRYEIALKKTGIENIELVELLPIENESRKLPKTGYYKGQPFWGTWAERNEVRELMNALLERTAAKNGWEMYHRSKDIINSKGELDFDKMESPKNLHLSPEYYRTNLRNKTVQNSIQSKEQDKGFFDEFFA